MMQFSKLNWPEKIYLTIATISLTAFLLFYISNIYSLLSRSYYIDEKQLYQLNTFHLLGRAFEQSENRGRSSQPELVFESKNRYSFTIHKGAFAAIKEKKKLEDTLMYDNTKFTVYTTKKYYEALKKSRTPIYIDVYQIEVGNKKYVDMDEMNSRVKSQKIVWIIFPLLAVGAIIFFNQKLNRMNKVTFF